jgi:hypothetical protein
VTFPRASKLQREKGEKERREERRGGERDRGEEKVRKEKEKGHPAWNPQFL